MGNVLLIIVLWSLSGLLACVAFRRRGHNLLLLAGLAVWMGPLIVYVMIYLERLARTEVDVVHPGEPLDGWLDVLVGVDGSPESTASAAKAIAMMRPALRRLRLVAVLDVETARNRDAFRADDRLEAALEHTAEVIAIPGAERALLAGRADRALATHAAEEGFDLIVVSHRNRPVASSLFGSTTRRLAVGTPVPLLIGPSIDGEVPDLSSETHTMKERADALDR